MTSKKGSRPAVILLIEDNPDDQDLARRALQHGKFANELHIVSNGLEALDYLYHKGRYEDAAKAPSPDLILLDLNMPMMNGIEFLRSVRQEPRMKTIPVVVLTTSDADNDVRLSYELGCNSYVKKPMNRAEMVRLFEFLDYYWLQLAVLPKE